MTKMLVSKKSAFKVVAVLVFILMVYRLLHFGKPRSRSCPLPSTDPDPVPNLVHFIHLDADDIPFTSFLCIAAAFIRQNPDKVYIHTNLSEEELKSIARFRRLRRLMGDKLHVNGVRKPTHVFGQVLGSVFHALDVLRIQLALKFGGLFLDQDTLLIQSVDDLRGHEVSLGWPKDQFLGTQFLLAKPNATFIRLWLESYRDYRPTLWYYNAGQVPTEDILNRCPQLIHREEEKIAVKGLSKELYLTTDWQEWRQFYAIHLLFRHRSYLVSEEDDENAGIDEFDEDNIWKYTKTFGVMAREVLKELEEVEKSI